MKQENRSAPAGNYIIKIFGRSWKNEALDEYVFWETARENVDISKTNREQTQTDFDLFPYGK